MSTARTTPQDDGSAPALPAPGGRVTRSYGPVERAGLMWLAVRDGVSATADAHGVPRSTLTTWMEESGGIGPVQEWLRAETAGRFLRFEQSLYDWAMRQLDGDSSNVEQTWITLRKLIDARTGVLAAQGQDAQPALAAAQATVTLKVIEKDGEVKVIDLGPMPEASDEG